MRLLCICLATAEDSSDALGSDGEREAVERDAETVTARGLGGDVVMAAAEVLNEGMSSGENLGRAVTLQSAHRPESCF